MWHRRVGAAFQLRLGCVCGVFEARSAAESLTRDCTGWQNSRSPIKNFARKVFSIPSNSFQFLSIEMRLRAECLRRDGTGWQLDGTGWDGSRSPTANFARKGLPIHFNSFQLLPIWHRMAADGMENDE